MKPSSEGHPSRSSLSKPAPFGHQDGSLRRAALAVTICSHLPPKQMPGLLERSFKFHLEVSGWVLMNRAVLSLNPEFSGQHSAKILQQPPQWTYLPSQIRAQNHLNQNIASTDGAPLCVSFRPGALSLIWPILSTNLKSRYHYLHFTQEETKAQRG